MVVVDTVVVVVDRGVEVVDHGVVVLASLTGAAVVVIFRVCRANDSRLVIDRFKRGRVTINKRAIRRDPQLHKTLLTQRRGRCLNC